MPHPTEAFLRIEAFLGKTREERLEGTWQCSDSSQPTIRVPADHPSVRQPCECSGAVRVAGCLPAGR
jgi:hypothetical protein